MVFSARQSLFTPHGREAEAQVEACWIQRAFDEVQPLHIFLKIPGAVNPRLPFSSPSPWGEAEAYLKANKP